MNLNEPYSRESFSAFIKNFLPGFSSDVRPVAIPAASSSTQEAHFLGESRDLDLSVFELRHSGSSDKRITLAQEGFRLMKEVACYRALVVYHSSDTDVNSWRLSLMTLNPSVGDKGKVALETSSPRRSSFFLGPDAKVHTPHDLLIKKGGVRNFDDLVSRFSVEVVTSEFFKQYRTLFEKLNKHLEKDHGFKGFATRNGIAIDDFAKKLLGQVVFIYFLQRKGWVGAAKGASINQGDKNFLRTLFQRSAETEKNFFNEYLEPLFYDALNKSPERAGSFYRDYFECQIPFLNGGLFEPLNNYDWRGDILYIPNEVFSNKEGSGILDVFDLYNFTVAEDDPVDVEVSVDPEMLGKVFENLLAENLRKGKGTYYTPREIVHYMCRESLAHYLASEADVGLEDIRKLYAWDDSPLTIEDVKNERRPKNKVLTYWGDFEENQVPVLQKALATIRIVDPACGSGAFLVGMLHEIVHMRRKLALITGERFSDYETKKQAIQDSIYGVDIDPGAVEIAKLRLWLSMVVDYDLDDIEPLPNLDYKIMQGNSLLEELVIGDVSLKLYDPKLNNGSTRRKRMNLFEEDDQQDLFGQTSGQHRLIYELNRLHREYFELSDLKAKRAKREKIKAIEHELVERTVKQELKKLEGQSKNIGKYLSPAAGMSEKDAKVYADNLSKQTQLAAILREFDASINRPYFLWHLNFADVFEQKGGFDVVIANPPYIDSEAMVKKGQAKIREAIQKTYKWTKGNWDIYIAFFELGFKEMNKNGTLTFITPDKWISKPFGNEFRKETIDNIFLILKAGRKIFDNAKVDSIISFFANSKFNDIKIVNLEDGKFVLKREINKTSLLPPFTFDHLFSDSIDLLSKIDNSNSKLIEFCKCENACATSDAYKLKPLLRDLSDELFNSKNDLQIINTGTIGKYYSKWGIREMTYLKHKYLYPVVDKATFLRQFPNSYGVKSLQPKIIIKGLNLLHGCLDKTGSIIPGKTTLIITDNDLSKLKFLLTIINSNLAFFYIREKYPSSSYNLGTSFTKDMINNLPIPKVTEKDKNILIEISEQIIPIATSDDYQENKKKQSQVQNLEHQIDKLVYKLYGLTDEEIQIVEGQI